MNLPIFIKVTNFPSLAFNDSNDTKSYCNGEQIKGSADHSKSGYDTTSFEANWSFPSPLLDIKYCALQKEKVHGQIMAWIKAEYKHLNKEMKQRKAFREHVGELETTFIK
ncbi:hypothetical protein L0F63_004041 [Massospora cicadina]|nr:hypothetical protein L0F63_004041 [Massospora cicadina]